jgi:hypothetical protein
MPHPSHANEEVLLYPGVAFVLAQCTFWLVGLVLL